MRRLIDRFAKSAKVCGSVSELRTLLDEATGELGFTYYALLHHCAVDNRQSSLVRLDNYPPAWIEERKRLLIASEDPVHQASRRTNVAFAWSDIGTLISLSSNQREILDASKRFGLGDGLTVPANIPTEPTGSFSFAVRRGFPLRDLSLTSAEIIGAYAFDAARRIFGRESFRQRPQLSKRELDCLRLIAIGKSDWETARILGISFDTVRQYVKRARSAYGVVTRTQLVVMGLRDNWISIEEVTIPERRSGYASPIRPRRSQFNSPT